MKSTLMKRMAYVLMTVVVSALLLSGTPPGRKVVFFGDSITEAGVQPGGYIAKMREMLAARAGAAQFDLLGAGISGNKVTDLYLRLEDDVLMKKPDVVVIWVGVNDVWHKASSGTGTDPDKFERFYEAIITKTTRNGSKLILCTPAAIGERKDFVNRMDGDLNFYSAIIRKLATKHGATLCDLRAAFLDHNLRNNAEDKDRGILTSDGVHLNEEGNTLVAKLLVDKLTALK